MMDYSSDLEPEQGPSWARPNWPVEELDALNLGLDPTQATIETVRAAVAQQAATDGLVDPDAVRRAADDSIRAMMLVRT
jgi:2-oxoglutarate dehydrogenase E1 component